MTRWAYWARVAAVCALCGGGLLACSMETDGVPEASLAAGKPQPAARADRPKAFRAKHVAVTHRDGRQLLLRLTAGEIIHRSRRSRFFTYRSFDEIFVRGLHVEFPQPATETKKATVSLPLREIADVLGAFGAIGEDFGFGTAATATAGDGDEATRLSRVLIEDVAFRMLPARQESIDLFAARAQISGDFTLVQFEGGMRLKGARCRLEAPTALWSTAHHGLLLPFGYRGAHGRRIGRTFLSVRGDGSCATAVPPPGISYRDLLEEHERDFYQRISRAMPAYAQFMLGVGGAKGTENPLLRQGLPNRHAASAR